MNGTISLDNMRFYACHGILEQETVVGGAFTVSLSLEVENIDEAVLADRIEGTVDYARVYACVESAMKQPSGLLEHVAGRIARGVLELFPKVASLSVTLRKLAPPIPHASLPDGVAVCLAVDRTFLLRQ